MGRRISWEGVPQVTSCTSHKSCLFTAFENKSPRDAVNELMQRVGKDELEYDPWKKRETETGKQRQG